MIWRDFFCSVCGHEILDIDGIREPFISDCYRCGSETVHYPIANGGIKTRYRHNDWPSDPLWYSGQTDSTITAYEIHPSGNETPVMDRKGQVLHEARKSTDKRTERRDRIRFHMKKRAGKNILYTGVNRG